MNVGGWAVEQLSNAQNYLSCFPVDDTEVGEIEEEKTVNMRKEIRKDRV